MTRCDDPIYTDPEFLRMVMHYVTQALFLFTSFQVNYQMVSGFGIQEMYLVPYVPYSVFNWSTFSQTSVHQSTFDGIYVITVWPLFK